MMTGALGPSNENCILLRVAYPVCVDVNWSFRSTVWSQVMGEVFLVLAATHFKFLLYKYERAVPPKNRGVEV